MCFIFHYLVNIVKSILSKIWLKTELILRVSNLKQINQFTHKYILHMI